MQKIPSWMFDSALHRTLKIFQWSLAISITSGFLSYLQLNLKIMVGLLSDSSLEPMSKIFFKIWHQVFHTYLPLTLTSWNWIFRLFNSTRPLILATLNSTFMRNKIRNFATFSSCKNLCHWGRAIKITIKSIKNEETLTLCFDLLLFPYFHCPYDYHYFYCFQYYFYPFFNPFVFLLLICVSELLRFSLKPITPFLILNTEGIKSLYLLVCLFCFSSCNHTVKIFNPIVLF